MREFTALIGQIFFIALAQTIIDVFFEEEKYKYFRRFISIAAIMAAMYLLLQFIFTYIMDEITALVKFPL